MLLLLLDADGDDDDAGFIDAAKGDGNDENIWKALLLLIGS